MLNISVFSGKKLAQILAVAITLSLALDWGQNSGNGQSLATDSNPMVAQLALTSTVGTDQIQPTAVETHATVPNSEKADDPQPPKVFSVQYQSKCAALASQMFGHISEKTKCHLGEAH